MPEEITAVRPWRALDQAKPRQSKRSQPKSSLVEFQARILIKIQETMKVAVGSGNRLSMALWESSSLWK